VDLRRRIRKVPGHAVVAQVMTTPAAPAGSPTHARRPRLWVPRRVLVTRSAAGQPHTAEILRRCEAAGVDAVELLRGDRLTGLKGDTERETYARAKATLAVVVAPPSLRVPQPIPPSADWRIDLARGCPAHCQYCYLAGSLAGPPVDRVYANLDEVLAPIASHAGRGTVTSGTADRGHEGTTFELSCYTDPLGIEHLTGSLSAAVAAVGRGDHGPEASLRFTTKYDAVAPLLGLPHRGRTRMRVSVNADEVAGRFEGGTATVAARLTALREMASAGYPVGLTVAPVMPVEGWRDAYGRLLADAASALDGVSGVDLTVELITHRFTPGSKEVLTAWYPRTRLEMDEPSRDRKRTKFGGVKYVYPREVMAGMRAWFAGAVEEHLPGARLLYWT
jgi:spore photoproduct lyase